jgi:hypothetical protein
VQRNPLTRSASLLAALVLLTTAGVDAWGLHPCPHHDPGIATAGEGGAGATHHERAHDAANASDDDQKDGRTHPCTCVGNCQVDGRAPALATSSAPGPTWLATTGARSAPTPHGDETLPGAPAYTLPFANAPPPLG